MTMDDFELDRRLHALAREADPPPGNWCAVQRRIRPRRWTAVAAAAAVFAGVVLVTSQFAIEPSSSSRLEVLVRSEAAAMETVAPEIRGVAAGDSGQALMAAWQENQDAITQLERALRRDPGNRLLLEFLTEARLRQARLARLGKSTPLENERSMKL